MAMTMGSSSSSSVLHIGSVKWFPNTWQHDYDDENDSLPAYTPYSYKYYANLPMSLVCSHLMDKATIKFDTPNLNFAESQTSKAMRIMTPIINFHNHPQLKDQIHIRIGLCMHRGRNTNGLDVFNLAIYSNISRNEFTPQHFASFRFIHGEFTIYGTSIVDREKKDALQRKNEECDGPPVAGKAYNRRIIFTADLFGSVYQFGCKTPPYAFDIDINPTKWYLVDSQRFRSFPPFVPESIDICIQFHVDHRKRVRQPRINNAWMFDPNMVGPPKSNMNEPPPMAAAGKHPTDPRYPNVKLVATSAYIRSLHPISHFNRVMMVRFDHFQQKQKQQQQQQQQHRKDQSTKPIPISNDDNNNSPQPQVDDDATSDVSSHFYNSSSPVPSNQSNPEEKQDNDDDVKQQQQRQMNTMIRCANSSSPSFQAPHHFNHNHNIPLRNRANPYNILQAFSIGTFVEGAGNMADPHGLIRLNTEKDNDNDVNDEDDDDNRPIAIPRVDTDNDDGMYDMSQSNPHLARTDTDNDLDIADQIQ